MSYRPLRQAVAVACDGPLLNPKSLRRLSATCAALRRVLDTPSLPPLLLQEQQDLGFYLGACVFHAERAARLNDPDHRARACWDARDAWGLFGDVIRAAESQQLPVQRRVP